MEHLSEQAPQDEVEAGYRILSFRSHAPKEYESFVYARWLNSLRYGNDMFRLMDAETYYAAYALYVEGVLKREDSRLRVAVLSDDEDTALGWSVDEGDVLHYVYVKPECRKAGIAKSLVPSNIKTITHITKIGLAIWQKKLPQAKFNPFL